VNVVGDSLHMGKTCARASDTEQKRPCMVYVSSFAVPKLFS
jgi:hypothetical protein